MKHAILTLLTASSLALLPASGLAAASAPDEPVILVATQAAQEGPYGRAVILAVPLREGGHYGFILNRPMPNPVADLFPNDPSAKRVVAHVNFGGPLLSDSMFAVVRARKGDEADMRIVSSELSVAIDAKAVKRVMAERPQDARYFLGMVAWSRGELADEIDNGLWQALPPNTALVLSEDTATLWNRLVPRGPARLVSNERRP